MQKIFHLDCPREVYQADACVLSCFDARFDAALHKFLKRRGVAIADHIRIPGSTKALAVPDCEGDRDFVLRMVRTSLRLHRPRRMLLFAHHDCGAYPGVAPHCVAADVLKAAEVLSAAEPSLQYEMYFCDFDGIYELSGASSVRTRMAP